MNTDSRRFSFAFTIFLALLAAGTVAAWTSPSSAPPNGNVVTLGGTPSVYQTSSAGLATYNVPAGTRYLMVEVWGAGGGGGGSGGYNASNSYASGGGGGGGYAMTIINNPASTYYYTVGSGGSGGANGYTGGYNGTAGGATCLGTNSSSPCTSPLVHAGGGGGGGQGVGGAGGIPSTGDVRMIGGPGQSTGGYNLSGYRNCIYGGAGGSAPRGGGGAQTGGSTCGSPSTATAGNPFGGGGSGNGNSNETGYGGAGGNGGIVITAYPN